MTWLFLPIPARDFEGGAEDLGTYEFRHDEGVARVSDRGGWVCEEEEWLLERQWLRSWRACKSSRSIGVGLARSQWRQS